MTAALLAAFVSLFGHLPTTDQNTACVYGVTAQGDSVHIDDYCKELLTRLAKHQQETEN